MLTDTPAFNSFAVDDAEAARQFYSEVLGIKVVVIDAEIGLLELKLAGGRDTFVYVKPDFVPATYTVLGFQVDDIVATVDQLRFDGVEFERYEGFDQDEKGIARGNGPEIAWFKDPAGNIISIVSGEM